VRTIKKRRWRSVDFRLAQSLQQVSSGTELERLDDPSTACDPIKVAVNNVNVLLDEFPILAFEGPRIEVVVIVEEPNRFPLRCLKSSVPGRLGTTARVCEKPYTFVVKLIEKRPRSVGAMVVHDDDLDVDSVVAVEAARNRVGEKLLAIIRRNDDGDVGHGRGLLQSETGLKETLVESVRAA
jgi:hypothetical protein